MPRCISRRTGEGGKTLAARIVGYAALFDSPSRDMGGWREYVRRGAFDRALRERQPVRATISHGQVIGSTTDGRLSLKVDSRGLIATLVSLPDWVLEEIDRGAYAGMSFSFEAVRDCLRSQGTIRELLDVNLLDVALAGRPVYPATYFTVQGRSSQPQPRVQPRARAVVQEAPCQPMTEAQLWAQACGGWA
jgi:HK97 family phage prohead protease